MDNFRETDSFDTPAKVVLRDGYTEDDLLPEKSFGARVKEAFSKKGIQKFAKNAFPQKNDSKKEKIRKIIMDISLVLLVGSLIYLCIYYVNYRGEVSDQDGLIKIYKHYEDLDDTELEQAWNDIKAKYPDVEFPEGMNIKFAELYSMNQDIAGRLTIPGTNIDTFVVQTNNNSYYLNKDFYGNYSRYGVPFANYSCSLKSEGLSKNTILYGHNTHDGLKFNQLTNYMTLAGYKNSPLVRFDTLFETTYWKVFGVILTNATSDLDNGHVFNCLYAEYTSDNEFMNVISGIAQRSMIKTNVDVKSTDKIISLYTCYQNVFSGGRLIVFARQVRDGETNDVDTSGAYFNESARYPQAYYDAKHLSNPYYSAPAYSYASTTASHYEEEDTIEEEYYEDNVSQIGDVF